MAKNLIFRGGCFVDERTKVPPQSFKAHADRIAYQNEKKIAIQ